MTEVVFLILIGAVILMISLHFETRKQLTLRHKQKCKFIKKEIALAEFQVNFRNKALKKYNFHTYNLNGSLVVQPEINLN